MEAFIVAIAPFDDVFGGVGLAFQRPSGFHIRYTVEQKLKRAVSPFPGTTDDACDSAGVDKTTRTEDDRGCLADSVFTFGKKWEVGCPCVAAIARPFSFAYSSSLCKFSSASERRTLWWTTARREIQWEACNCNDRFQ